MSKPAVFGGFDTYPLIRRPIRSSLSEIQGTAKTAVGKDMIDERANSDPNPETVGGIQPDGVNLE